MSQENKLVKQFSIIGIGTIITLMLGLLNTPIITRLVTPEAYGNYSLFQTYGTLAVSVLYLGMDQGLVRYFYKKDNISYRSNLLLRSIGIPLLITSILIVILIGTNSLLQINLFDKSTFFLLLIIYIYIFMIKRFSDLVLRLQFHSKLFSINNIVNKLVFLVSAIGLIVFSPLPNDYSLILALLISGIVVVIIAIFYERDIWNFKKYYVKKTDINTQQLIKYSLPYVLSMAITSLFNANDKLFVDYFSTSVELGIFSSASSIVALINIIQTTFNTVWAPAALEHYSKYPDDKEYHKNGNHVITVIMFIVGLSIIFLKDIFVLFLDEDYRQAAYIIPGLMFGPIMYTISETTVSGIVFKEKSHMNILIALVSFFVDFIANLLLVPKFGAIGAGLSTGVSYIVFFTLRTLISNKFYYIDFSLLKFYCLTLISFGFAIYNSFNSFNMIIVIWYIACIMLVIIFYFDVFKDTFYMIKNRFLRLKK